MQQFLMRFRTATGTRFGLAVNSSVPACSWVVLLVCSVTLWVGCSAEQPQPDKSSASDPEAAGDTTSTDTSGVPAETVSTEDPAAFTPDGATSAETDSENTGSTSDEILSLEVPTEPQSAASVPNTQSMQAPEPLSASEAPLPLDLLATADLPEPQVVLSAQHAALCKVRVGDPFPAMELSNLEGQQKSINELFGDKLTLVVFWNAQEPTGQEELHDLTRYYLPRFGEQGLSVVAINTGNRSEQAAALSQKAGTSYPVLSDPDGSALAKVATGKLPRTYLLDPSGKIVWFDMEYSPTTRRDMASILRRTLEK